MKDTWIDDTLTNTNSNRKSVQSRSTLSKKKKLEMLKKKIWQQEKDIDLNDKQEMAESNRNVVIFTGRALVEILRDQTMQKSFMTLAYISDMMVGSEISPI